MRNAYISPRDPEARDNPPPARGTKKTPKSALELAQLEHDLETTGAELLIATAAQVAASTRWQAEKAVLDGWEDAVRRLGPAARYALDSMPKPGADTMGAPTGQIDFRNTSHGIAAQMNR